MATITPQRPPDSEGQPLDPESLGTQPTDRTHTRRNFLFGGAGLAAVAFGVLAYDALSGDGPAEPSDSVTSGQAAGSGATDEEKQIPFGAAQRAEQSSLTGSDAYLGGEFINPFEGLRLGDSTPLEIVDGLNRAFDGSIMAKDFETSRLYLSLFGVMNDLYSKGIIDTIKGSSDFLGEATRERWASENDSGQKLLPADEVDKITSNNSLDDPFDLRPENPMFTLVTAENSGHTDITEDSAGQPLLFDETTFVLAVRSPKPGWEDLKLFYGQLEIDDNSYVTKFLFYSSIEGEEVDSVAATLSD